jgi:hypothetical protein
MKIEAQRAATAEANSGELALVTLKMQAATIAANQLAQAGRAPRSDTVRQRQFGSLGAARRWERR